ncbi:PadR family transcriptional regulator [Limosilactobacillus sp. STM2_1]|uniref:PadR family transcriptional regulator n=1 Tax=Limosilactobacillus rudii TaxID=2759755 RepID=A0A7W3YMC2_9LACO|nr:PadR family transcriptional regulator [Limosilactobacillus rudii]MBB1079230.1 PadR family transcriptional regulator [Limosilactobacillus rudii]MBB1097319.1 PadR family transcriptional regulator [Limosilactobacillus rudii]MCD7134428.1 PadR family transcriptional regulator [Limosilactobacillus rudii]
MPKKRILPFIILGIINNHPQITGREITAEFDTEIGDFWRASHSQVYPELKRMVNDGWIYDATSKDNAKERYYTLTDEGREILNKWLGQLVTDLPVHEDLFSLKLFFIKDKHDKRIPQLIARQLVLLKKDLKYLMQRRQTVFPNEKTIQNNYGHYLILARAISRTQGQIQWLKDTQKLLKEEQ